MYKQTISNFAGKTSINVAAALAFTANNEIYILDTEIMTEKIIKYRDYKRLLLSQSKSNYKSKV